MDTITICPVCELDLIDAGGGDWCPDCGCDLKDFGEPPEDQPPEETVGVAPEVVGMEERRGRRKMPIDILTKREVMRLLSRCKRTNTGSRNRAMISLMYYGGLRFEEATKMMPSDIQGQRLQVVSGKGNKRRVCRLTRGGLGFVRAWQIRRSKLDLPADAPLLCVLSGKGKGIPLDQRNVEWTLRKLKKAARISKRVHPHGFRHSHAFMLAELNVPLHKIKAQLGHSSSAVTSQYIDHVSGKDLESLEDVEWD